jgi:hypothetical protein
MIGMLLKPLIPWLLRRLFSLLLHALGRDLCRRLPQVFALIDEQIISSMQRGSRSTYIVFFTSVQRVVHRDPSDMELRVLQLLFDPSIAAEHQQPTTTADR